jgi:GPH family glycoside/pentoside/hexuronide:cation symporter
MAEGVILYMAALTGFWVARDLTTGIVAAGLIGVGIAAAMLLLEVLIADVIDEDHLRTGRRREGMYFGMHALILRLNGVVAFGTLGLVLSLSGYDPALAQQPESALMALRLLVTVIPAVMLVLALVFLRAYPLHGERLARIRAGVREHLAAEVPA